MITVPLLGNVIYRYFRFVRMINFCDEIGNRSNHFNKYIEALELYQL